jgi:hypothetical protein
MATQVQWRGGSTAEHATFTGAAREVTVDTQKQTLVVHDGSTVGGEALLREDQANLPGSVTNGIYTPGTNQVAVATNGAGRLFVDSTGNLGVGTINATNAAGRIHSRADSNEPKSLLVLQNRDTGSDAGGAINFVNGGVDFSDSRYSYIRGIVSGAGQNGNHLVFGTNANGQAASERLRITSAGLVGIGTSAPNALLSVGNTSSHSIGLSSSASFYGAGSQVSSSVSTVGAFSTETATVGVGGVFAFGGKTNNVAPVYPFAFIQGAKASAAAGNYSGYLRFLTVPADGGVPVERLRISEAGNVGIGTTAPNEMLTIGTSSAGGNIRLNSSSYGNNGLIDFFGTDGNRKLQISTAASQGTLYTPASTDLAFEVGNSERVRIDSSGRLLAGTSSSSANARAVIQGRTTSATDQGVLYIQRGSSGPGVVADGSGIGEIWFADSNGYAAANIQCLADNTWDGGGNDYPGRLVFSTTADGASSPTERMRIKSSGIINFSNAPVYADNAAALAGGLVAGDVYRKADGTLMITF